MNVFGAGLFCEDFRQEVQGTYSLIGVLADSILLSPFPIMLGKLGAHARVHYPCDIDPVPVTVRLLLLDGQVMEMGAFDADQVTAAQQAANSIGLPWATLASAIVLAPFSIPRPGKIVMQLEVGGEAQPIGILSIAEAPTTSA